MKGQESLFSQVFVLAISMFAVWITFVYSAFFKFNKNLQKNSAELIYRKCSPRKFCRINLQLYVCNMFFSSCFFFLKKLIISADHNLENNSAAWIDAITSAHEYAKRFTPVLNEGILFEVFSLTTWLI